MESCVRYCITPDEVRGMLGSWGEKLKENDIQKIIQETNFWEVWEGLPTEYQFMEDESRGGQPTLRVKTDRVYIWVWPDGRRAVEQNPRSLLSAVGHRRPDSIHFIFVDPVPEGMTLADAIVHAKSLNRNYLRDSPAVFAVRKRYEQSLLAKPRR